MLSGASCEVKEASQLAKRHEAINSCWLVLSAKYTPEPEKAYGNRLREGGNAYGSGNHAPIMAFIFRIW